MRTTFSQNLISQLTKGTSSITTVHSIYLIGAKKVNTSYGYTTFDSEEEIIPELNCYSLSVVIITYGKFSVSKEFMNLIYTKMQEKVQVCPSTIAVCLRDTKFHRILLLPNLEKETLMCLYWRIYHCLLSPEGIRGFCS